MKYFVGGLVFGALIYPGLCNLALVVESAANVLVTKLGVIVAKDAASLEDTGTTHAIGFSCEDYGTEMEDEEE